MRTIPYVSETSQNHTKLKSQVIFNFFLLNSKCISSSFSLALVVSCSTNQCIRAVLTEVVISMWYLSPQIKKKLVWEWGRTSLQVRLGVKGKINDETVFAFLRRSRKSPRVDKRQCDTLPPVHIQRTHIIDYTTRSEVWDQLDSF